LDLHVREQGSGEHLVVFVHGVLDRGRSFDAVAERLAGECRVVTYDRRGYGASRDLGPVAGIEPHIDDVLTVLDGRRAVVVGHSFGGIVAMGATVRAPDLVDALVLYESVVAWAPGWNDTPIRTILAAPDPEDAGLRLMFRERYATMSDDLRRRLRVEARTFVEEEAAVRNGTPPYDVSELQPPVVYGRGDAPHLPPILAFLEARVPCLEVVTIPGADHHAHRSEPDAFAGLVRRGLELARG
jgi:pimeloyl-ACP methyl ester carboxylesterase